MRPDSWASRFIRDAIYGRAEFAFDPERNQARIIVGEEGDEELIAYQDITGPVGDLFKTGKFRLEDVSAAEMIAMIQKQADHKTPED